MTDIVVAWLVLLKPYMVLNSDNIHGSQFSVLTIVFLEFPSTQRRTTVAAKRKADFGNSRIKLYLTERKKKTKEPNLQLMLKHADDQDQSWSEEEVDSSLSLSLFSKYQEKETESLKLATSRENKPEPKNFLQQANTDTHKPPGISTLDLTMSI